jgi:aminopeptidase N
VPSPGPATAIVPGAVDRSSLDIRASYFVDVRLAVAARALGGSVQIVATNRSGGGIDRLELNTVMAPLGRLELGDVTVDGAPVTPAVDDQTLIVPLGGVLPDGATTTLVIPFSATLRSGVGGSDWLLTRANGVVDLYRWIPWISRMTPFSRPNHGDPFVTPVSPQVTVLLQTDVPMVVATTGVQTSASEDGRTRVFSAINVRDFTLAAAADYRTSRASVGDTEVRVLTRPGGPASAMLAAAKAALSKLETRLGPYPYPVLEVIQSAGGYGMEGPGVAWIPTGAATSDLTYLVTHEIAHQWFYGIVGSDQARDPFADEATADFVARYVLGMRRTSRCATTPLDRTIYRYTSACYYETVYIQGGNLLEAARQKMGSTAFWAAFRGYLADNRWGLADTRTLLDALDAATPVNLEAWWRGRFPTLY